MTPPREPHGPIGRRAWALDALLAMGAAAVEVAQTFEPEPSPPVVSVMLAFVAGRWRRSGCRSSPWSVWRSRARRRLRWRR